VILGPTSGSGAAIARALAHDPGLHIFGIHRGNHPEGAREVAAAVEAAGRRIHYRVAEAGKCDSAELGVDELLAVAGPRSVRMFVHSIANASIGHLVAGDPLLHPKQFAKTFDSMAHSFVYWVRELVQRDLLAPGGRLLALTNAVTESTLSHLSAIAASKSALETYVKYMARELGPLGFRVNALKYGTVETTALEHIFPAGLWQRVRPLHDRMFAAGRMGKLDEVGRFVSVLARDEGEWFNGAVIDFTGAQMHSLYQLLMDVAAESVEAAK
jgi:NAD(P)-dependent dehydrogenase (short-subunit alcohol dehydrogenase family)